MNQINPLYDDKTNIAILQGHVDYQESVIHNLRQQIRNLNDLLKDRLEITKEEINKVQFKHIKGIQK